MGALASAKAQRAASRAGRLAAGAGLLLAACLLGSIRHKQAVWPVSSARIGAQAPEIGFDVAVPSSLAGKTQKHGKLGILTQLNRAHKQHGEAVPLFPPEWVAQRVGGDRHAPPPLRVAHIMISDKYKLVYVKCTKTAGSSMVRAFTESLCGCQEGVPCDCLSFVNYTDPAAVQHAIDSWDDYFVFGFSRNVLRRAISQYQYLTQLFDPACPVLSWEQYCHDPYLLGDMCTARTPKPSPRAGRPCCLPSPAHHYEHAAPQAHCLTTEDGRTAVDWVGRVEAVEEDLAALVEHLNARPGVPKLQPLRPGQLGRVNINSGACQEADPRRC